MLCCCVSIAHEGLISVFYDKIFNIFFFDPRLCKWAGRGHVKQYKLMANIKEGKEEREIELDIVSERKS